MAAAGDAAHAFVFMPEGARMNKREGEWKKRPVCVRDREMVKVWENRWMVTSKDGENEGRRQKDNKTEESESRSKNVWMASSLRHLTTCDDS